MNKKNMNRNNSHSFSNQRLKSYQTEEFMTKPISQKAFYNMLRCDSSSGHPETKMRFVPIKVNQRKVPQSHIFTGEDPSQIKVSRKSKVKYNPSNVLFNDYYFEKNPKINPIKKKKYEMENKWKNNKYPYSDEFITAKCKKDIMKRRVEENYKTNPLKINTKEENMKMNNELAEKVKSRTKAYNGFLGSKNCKRVLGGIRRFSSQENMKVNKERLEPKVTNNNFNINKRSMILNRNKDKQVPYYGKKRFRCISLGKALTYA